MTTGAEVRLVALDRGELASLLQDPDAFASSHQLDLGVLRDAVSTVAARSLASSDGADAVMPWGGYLGVDSATGQAIGTCSYLGAPDADRAVEIAYYTFDPFQGRGYASAMASELTSRARASGEVAKVVAHTRAEENASAHILRRIGLVRVGELIDSDDGPIWRWET